MYEGVVYKVTNIHTGQMYVGQTTQYIKRVSAHRRGSFSENSGHYGSRLHQDIRNFGVDSFVFDIICNVSAPTKPELRNELYRLEEYYISEFDTYHNGYNETIGGLGHRGFKPSESTIMLRSQKMKGRVFSDEHCQRISESKTGEGHHFYGKHLSESHKQNIREANSGERCYWYGKKRNRDEIEKMIVSKSIPIVQLSLDGSLISEWHSSTFVARELGINAGNITQCCRGKKKTYKNCLWKYKSEYYGQ